MLLDVDISTWTDIQPEFIMHCNVNNSLFNNVWDFSKLKHEDKKTQADLILEVSKLINNVGTTATPFTIPAQATYTNAEVKKK